MSSWAMPSPRAREARARSSPATVSGEISSSSTNAADNSGEWAGHDLEQMDKSGELPLVELIEKPVLSVAI